VWRWLPQPHALPAPAAGADQTPPPARLHASAPAAPAATQVLEFVDCHLFNQLLLRPECCSTTNARYALRGLKLIDSWIVAESSAGAEHHPVLGHHRGAADSTAGARWQQRQRQQQVRQGGGAADDPPRSQQQQQQQQQEAGSDAAAAGGPSAAAAGEGIDAGWEQVPADVEELDSWQPPHAQQQQQQPWWRLQHQQRHTQASQQQQQQWGGAPELGPEAWSALSHIRQVSRAQE
jgi:hypothetical protein